MPSTTCVMCRPVMAKNVAPNSGTPHSLWKGVTCSSLISFNHSVRWSATKVPPATIVARSHLPVAPRSPLFIECTAITLFKLVVRSAKVITLENMMAGENSKGFGQSGLDTRLYDLRAPHQQLDHGDG